MSKRRIEELPESSELPQNCEVLLPIFLTCDGNPGHAITQISFRNLIAAIRKELELGGSVVITEEDSRALSFKIQKKGE